MDQSQHLIVRLDQGVLEGSSDWTGFANQKSTKTLDRFFLVNDNFEKIVKPPKHVSDSDSDDWKQPIKLEIKLSKDAFVVQNLKSFTLADLLIALGGISRSFYLMGMVCATFASKILYKKALIEDLFMWQKPQKAPPAKYQTSLKSNDSAREELLHLKHASSTEVAKSDKTVNNSQNESKKNVKADEFKDVYDALKPIINGKEKALL